MLRLGGKPNQIVYWSGLLDWRNQTLTPNPGRSPAMARGCRRSSSQRNRAAKSIRRNARNVSAKAEYRGQPQSEFGSIRGGHQCELPHRHFATGKAVSRDTVIGKRISGPLACSARRITDLRRLFRRDLAQIYNQKEKAL
jgi:hypothetical protein